MLVAVNVADEAAADGAVAGVRAGTVDGAAITGGAGAIDVAGGVILMNAWCDDSL